MELRTVSTSDFVQGLISQRREYVFVEISADFVKGGRSESLFFLGLEPSFSSRSEGTSLGSINCRFGRAFLFERIGPAANYLAQFRSFVSCQRTTYFWVTPEPHPSPIARRTFVAELPGFTTIRFNPEVEAVSIQLPVFL